MDLSPGRSGVCQRPTRMHLGVVSHLKMQHDISSVIESDLCSILFIILAAKHALFMSFLS